MSQKSTEAVSVFEGLFTKGETEFTSEYKEGK